MTTRSGWNRFKTAHRALWRLSTS